MKRDMDLIRDILFAVEAADEPPDSEAIAIERRTAKEVGYHTTLLIEAQLLNGFDTRTFGSEFDTWGDLRLTWNGHDFLDAARNDSTWNRARASIVEKVGTVSFDVLKAFLVELSKQALSGQLP